MRSGLGLILAVWVGLSTAAVAAVDSPSATVDWKARYERARELMQQGKEEEALTLARETQAQAQGESGEAALAVQLESRRELAQLYLRCHRFDVAEKMLVELTDVTRRAYGEEDSRTIEALYDLGWFYSNLTRFDRAQSFFEQALRLDEKTVGRKHRNTAQVLNALGVLYENKADYARAEDYFLEAIAIQTEQLGADTLTTATTVNNLATLYWIRGDYRKAEKFFLQALAVRERLKGRGSLVTATTVNNLALVSLAMGDYARAESLFWRVLRIREQKLGANHPLTLTTVNHLGLLYENTGDYKAAESFLQRAAQSREKVIGADQPDTARAIFHLAHLYDTMGQYAKAEPLHRRALEIRERILGATHPETAASYGFLGRHYHLAGQPAEALPLYEKALAAQRSVLGPNHTDVLKTTENLACLDWQLGRREEALKLVRAAADIREYQLRNLFLFASEDERIGFQKTVNFYDLICTLGDAESIARVADRTKGIVLDSLLEEKRIQLSATDPEVKQAVERLQVLARELQSAKPEAPDFDREGREREADRLRDQLAEKLGLENVTRRALRIEPAEIAQAVPEGAVLVDWIRYRECRPNLRFEEAYGAVVQRRGRAPQWVRLGPAAPIEEAVRGFQKQMRRRVRDAAVEASLQQVEKLIWQPIERELGPECRQVILSPDAELNFVSFATLVDGSGRFLAERYNVEYVSSARDLLLPSMTLPREKTWLLVAAPDFGKPAVGSAFRLPALNGAVAEAGALCAEGEARGLRMTVLEGDEASESNVRQAHSPTLLHFSTHGVYSSQTADAKGIPRGFLALAGAQRTLDAWQRGETVEAESDGILFPEEVASLDLQGTWLVVLSACDTGLGRAQVGEGVLGLRRGFLLAGARTVVTSLWPVDDAESVAFMTAFYRRALQTADATTALAEVQRQELVRLRKERGLWAAVHAAGPFLLTY